MRDAQSHVHVCADCGIPTESFLCERCAEICEALTAEGKYYAYKTGQLDASELPPDLSAEIMESLKTRNRMRTH